MSEKHDFIAYPKLFSPINLNRWVNEHRHLLKPPVGNQQVWENKEFMITVVGGPNSRNDYHVNEGEEFFYQLEGDIILNTVYNDKFNPIRICEGEIFVLPSGIPHSPQRPKDSIGLVIERHRKLDELDGFIWYCKQCNEKLYEEYIHITNLVTQLPQVFDRFYQNRLAKICKKCGTCAEKN